jgi:F-type H+-transporting ATPase subunit alpha
MELMKQNVHEPLPVAKQVAAIFAGTNGFLDDVPADQVRRFEADLHTALDAGGAGYVKLFNEKKVMSDDVKKVLTDFLADFKRTFK